MTPISSIAIHLRRRRRDRRGYVLIVFALIVFAVMGTAALVLDMGFARLSQMQMQSAANSAALEGLRYRDDFPLNWVQPGSALAQELPQQPSSAQSITDPGWRQWRDQARRVLASQQAQLVFDDDLDPSDGDALQLGAGPVVGFSGGVGDPSLHASEDISIGATPVYKPQLQLNLAEPQAVDGDIVAGTYGQNANYAGPTGVDEAPDYTRPDFQPDAGSGGTTTPVDNALLVRMRRSNEDFGAGDGVRSSGEPLPYLFGRGSLMSRDTIGQGITVRATAIAATGNVTLGSTPVQIGQAKTVGPPHTDPNFPIPGLAPFALTSAFWTNSSWQANNGSLTATVNNGTISTQALGPVGVIETAAALPAPGVLSIGQQFPSDQPPTMTALTNATSAPQLYAYVPIYEQLPTSPQAHPQTIIGFGYVQWTYSPTTSLLTLNRVWDPNQPQGQQLIDVIGRGNVSGILAIALPASLSAADVPQLFSDHNNLSQSLLVPALANHHQSVVAQAGGP